MAIEHSIAWATNGYNGLIDWLGENKVGDTFANPDTVRGYVTTSQISNQSGSLTADKAIDQATGTSSNRSHTTNAAHCPWWVIDFGASNSVAATRIGIIGQASAGNHPKNTHIQGSVDGAVWNELVNLGGTAVANNTWTSWAVTDTTPYRYFRIRHVNNPGDSSSNNYLVLGDVEIWGDYHDTPASSSGDVTFTKFPGLGWSGLFEWLGQNKSASAWAHPETSRALVVTSMSTTQASYTTHGALDHVLNDASASHSQNVAGSWWKVDLGSGNLFKLTALALWGRTANNPRNFKVEGSLDDSVWDELYDVPNGSTGPTSGAWSAYDMDTATDAYRYFRITQYGVNSAGGDVSNENYLAIGALEFYGVWNPTPPEPEPDPGLVQGAAITVELGFNHSILDDAITWVDVTDRVREVSFTRGRQFELDRVEAGTGSVTLDNRDGELTPGNTASAWYPHVRSSTPIRIRAEWDAVTYGLFLGLIEDIPMTFPGRKDSVVAIPFTDMMKVLASARTRPQFAVLVNALTPRAFWRFADLTDSGPEGDHTLTAAGGPTTGVAGAWTDDLAYRFDGTDDKVTASDGAADLDLTGDFTAVVVMDGTNIPLSSGGYVLERNDGSDHAPYMIFTDDTQSIVRWKSGAPSAPVFTDAAVPWTDVGNGAGLADGWQVLAWVRAGNVVSHYSNGALRGSVTVPPDAIIDIVSASAETVIGAGDSMFTELDVSEVALWDRALSGAEIAGLSSALAEPFPVERTDERIDRLLTAAGVPAASIDLETGVASMSASSSGDEVSILEEIGKATDTEAGVLFIDRDGVVRFHDRHYRIEDSAAVSGTFGPSNLTIFDLEAGLYDALIFNEVSVTPGDAGSPVIVTDAASIDKHGPRSRQLTIYPADAASAAQHAAYVLSLYADNGLRVPRLDLALGNDTDLWAVVLGAEIGDRFRVIKTLEGDDLDQEVFLEAVTHTLSAAKTWGVSWDLSPASTQAAFWILGTSTLGETTILNL